MSSAIRCISCNQKINLAPGSSGIIVCPMCKSQQPVPEDHGQHAPDLDNLSKSTTEPSIVGTEVATSQTEARSRQSRGYPEVPPVSSGHQFGSGSESKGGCGCLLVGLLVAVPSWAIVTIVFAQL